MEPPFITFKSPYGGFGLKTRTSEAACGRVDGLLAALGVDVELGEVELSVAEPCPPALATAIAGPIDPVSAGYRSTARGLSAPADELARAHDHAIGDVARAAWTAFGAPVQAGADQHRAPPRSHVLWTWTVARDVARATAAYPPFRAFMHRHQTLMENDYAPAVRVRGIWRFRLHSATRGVVGPPYRESQIHAHLSGRHATAFFDLVFPHDAPVADFVSDYRDVCDALGMRLPPTALRLCSPTRAGRRKWTKVNIPPGAIW